MTALDLDAIKARSEQYANRYPWRLMDGAKDFLPRDRAQLVAEVERLRLALEQSQREQFAATAAANPMWPDADGYGSCGVLGCEVCK